jgi:hypothetical protein
VLSFRRAQPKIRQGIVTMKIFTSAAPISGDLKAALSQPRGREAMLAYMNARAAGTDAGANLVLQVNGRTLELSAQPVEPTAANDDAK